MSDLASRFTDDENEDGMAFAAIAFWTTGLVADGALQQGTAQQFRSGEVGGEFIAAFHDFLLFHYLE